MVGATITHRFLALVTVGTVEPLSELQNRRCRLGRTTEKVYRLEPPMSHLRKMKSMTWNSRQEQNPSKSIGFRTSHLPTVVFRVTRGNTEPWRETCTMEGS